MATQQTRLADPDGRLDSVRAVVALVAGQRNVVATDESDVDLAMRIVDVFAHNESSSTLTVEQVARLCGTTPDDVGFRSRFDLLVHEGVLHRRFGKAHQQRYTLNPAAYSGRLVFDRLRSDQGVSELIRLLDHTLRLLSGERATAGEVANALTSMRTMLRLHAEVLTAAAESALIAAVYAMQRAHSISQFAATIDQLHEMALQRFPDALGRHARGLLEDAQTYQEAVSAVTRRVTAEGAAARTFVVLSPEEYRAAAASSDLDALAAVVEHLLFDPPPAHMDAGAVADAVDRPPAETKERPEAPPEVPVDDPVEKAQAAERRRRDELTRTAERLLDGGDSVDLTSVVGAGWPGAAKLIASLLTIHRDPLLPFEVVFSDAVLVDPAGPVTYLTPVALLRIPTFPSPPDRQPAEGVVHDRPVAGVDR